MDNPLRGVSHVSITANELERSAIYCKYHWIEESEHYMALRSLIQDG